ncbi:hypothetical protein HNY73_010713 [Argiope bruennichi]|uniref:Reverse transcriptase domain-containing protein n=1 Tax=Argiope bruennichi TaxID=94029 RepID=A0A8T0F4D5_ARGBR|nr:hypothetical protein HNY73_010713 [Argiope bruennichi]
MDRFIVSRRLGCRTIFKPIIILWMLFLIYPSLTGSGVQIVCKLYSTFKLRGRIMPWIADFLKARYIRVKFRDTLSGKFRLRQSIPQGSVLSPTWFSLFIAGIEAEANSDHSTIIQACKKVFKIKKQSLTENSTWWTGKLKIEKKRVNALRRKAQRSSSEERSEKYLQWKTEVKKYMKKVKRAKSVGWKDLCTEAANPYGKNFKAAFRKTIHPSQLTVLHNINPEGRHQKIAQDILEQIFPFPNSTPSLTHEITTTPNDCPFTEKEIAQVIDNLPHGKAPGYNERRYEVPFPEIPVERKSHPYVGDSKSRIFFYFRAILNAFGEALESPYVKTFPDIIIVIDENTQYIDIERFVETDT